MSAAYLHNLDNATFCNNTLGSYTVKHGFDAQVVKITSSSQFCRISCSKNDTLSNPLLKVA